MGGSPDDKFVNSVELPQLPLSVSSFLLGRAPVTEKEWSAFAGSSPRRSDGNLPVVFVSRTDAEEYLKWYSNRIGFLCRLPTEIEWEYACRAGGVSLFGHREDISIDEANFLYNEQGERVGPGKRSEVGTYPENSFGLIDMIGNVCEWTSTEWRSSLDLNHSSTHPNEKFGVIRGGAWDHLPRLLRASWRDRAPINARYDNLGFRVAADLQFN